MAESVTGENKKMEPGHPHRSLNKSSPSTYEQESKKVLTVPFRGQIRGGMGTARKIVIVGIVEAQPNRFYIALSCGRGTSKEPPLDVALEIAVRLKDRQVLRKACISGTWGETERHIPFFPFIRDQPFKLEIHCEQSRFRVFVDGEKLFDFQHRLTCLNDIDTLWINGGVRVTKLA